MKWIRCSDRLPEINQQILVYLGNGPLEGEIFRAAFIHYEVGPINRFIIEQSCCSGGRAYHNEITHWMPLPGAPE